MEQLKVSEKVKAVLPGIRMIALDLDGTTLTRAGLTRRTKETLERAIKYGYSVVIATGRPISAVPDKVKEIRGLEYLVSSNGAHITDMRTKETIYSNCISKEACASVRELFMSTDFVIEVFTGGNAYIDTKLYKDLEENGSAYLGWKYMLRTRKPVDDIYGFWLEHIDEIENINIHFEFIEDREKMRARLSEIQNITVTSSIWHNLEVGGSTTSKREALTEVCRLKNVEMSELIGFGDSPNDMAMLDAAGIAVAMGNASDEVKAHADIVAPTNEEEGVSYVIEKYLLGKEQKKTRGAKNNMDKEKTVNIISKGQNPLGYEKISVLLRKFAVPSIVAMIVSALYNIVDQIFIGNGVGYIGNAATNVAFPMTSICLAAALLIGIGGASRFSLQLGAGNEKEAARSVGAVIWLSSTVGILIAILINIFMVPMLNGFGATEASLPLAVSYVRVTSIGMPFLIFTNCMSNLIRADGKPKYSMMCMIVGAVVNTILDPIFIFVLQRGVKGAAEATVIAQVISWIVAILYLRRFRTVKITKDAFVPSLKRWIKVASLGLSNSFNQVALIVLQIVLNNSLTFYGAQSIYGEDIPLSAAGIVMKVNMIVISVFIGLSQGSQPIIGFNYGAQKYDRVKSVYKLSLGCSFIISIAAFIAYHFFPEAIISLFGSGDELYMEFAVKFLSTFVGLIIIANVQVISSNFFSAIGKPIKGVILSLSRQIIILVPLMLILPKFFGLEGLIYAGPIADSLACIIALIMIIVEFKGISRLQEEQKLKAQQE